MSETVTLESLNAKLDDVLNALDNVVSVLAQLAKPGKLPPGPVAAHKPRADRNVTIATPQPENVIANAGEVVIHFGISKGLTIAKADEKEQLAYFITRWTPRSKRHDGSLWPDDQLLLDAVRTYWHEKQGTLREGYATEAPKIQEPEQREAVEAPPLGEPDSEEDRPF